MSRTSFGFRRSDRSGSLYGTKSAPSAQIRLHQEATAAYLLISPSTSALMFVSGPRFSRSISLRSVLPDDRVNSKQIPGGKYRKKNLVSRILRLQVHGRTRRWYAMFWWAISAVETAKPVAIPNPLISRARRRNRSTSRVVSHH